MRASASRTFPEDGQGVNELVVAADSNLYVSKRRGGNAITGAGHIDPSRAKRGRVSASWSLW